jgi:hypothetical protein
VKQVGLTPVKMALLVLLAAVLIGVLYHQLGGSTTKPPAVAAHRSNAREASAVEPNSGATQVPSAKVATTRRKKTTIRDDWQSPSLANVEGYDPFALPASFPQPPVPGTTGALAQVQAKSREDEAVQLAALAAEREQTQSQLIGLRQQGVQVIIKRNDQYVAIVGEQEVHVGDQLNGFTVTAIDADSVHVAKDLSQ